MTTLPAPPQEESAATSKQPTPSVPDSTTTSNSETTIDAALAAETTATAEASTKRKITRSRIGCFTCRRRKKACDLGKPICQGCTRLGLDCEWPTNYQDTLPKKRAAEALAAAARATGRSETLDSASRSRSASRARDAKLEKNGGPNDTSGHGHANSNAQRHPGDHGYSPPSRRSSMVGSTYEDDSWMFPERMSYIHGDPDDMFDIYDESLAPGPAQHPVPNFATQTMQAQQFNPQLQHRSSAPGYMQMYSQSHQPMPHQNSSEHFHLPPPPSMSASNISTGIYAEPIGHSSAPGGQSSASGHVLPKSHQHSHHDHTGPPLNTTGLALTLDPTHINQHHGTPVSVNHLQPNMNNNEWNHQTSGNYAAQIDHEDPLIQLLADGCYPSMLTDSPISSTVNQPHQSQQRQQESSDNHRDKPISATRDSENKFASSLENSLWAGLDPEQRRLRTLVLEYYTQYLSKLVSCDHVDQGDVSGTTSTDATRPTDRRAAGFDAFRNLAASAGSVTTSNGGAFSHLVPLQPDTSTSPSSTWGPAQILHTALLAWASRHWLNKGEARYEAASEVWGKRAETMLARFFDETGDDLFRASANDSLQQPSRKSETTDGNGQAQGGGRDSARGLADGLSDVAARQGRRDQNISAVTTLAAALMIVQWKICRGDICDFQPIMRKLRTLADLLFVEKHDRRLLGSMEFHFMENLLYQDVLSTSIYVNAPILNYDVLASYSHVNPTVVHTLTGLALPVFIIMYRIAGLIRKKRDRASQSLREGTSWRYDELVDLVSEAESIQQDLDTEKRLIDEVIEKNPRLEAHRCLHEAFRLACVLQLRCQVLNEPSTSLPIRLLIRQLLGLLESMEKQNLPGWCSCHWVQFQTALYCLDNKGDNDQSDRDRINRLYDRTFRDLAFLNVPRSHKVIREVWRRSDAEGRQVDWLDVVQEWDWDLNLV